MKNNKKTNFCTIHVIVQKCSCEKTQNQLCPQVGLHNPWTCLPLSFIKVGDRSTYFPGRVELVLPSFQEVPERSCPTGCHRQAWLSSDLEPRPGDNMLVSQFLRVQMGVTVRMQYLGCPLVLGSHHHPPIQKIKAARSFWATMVLTQKRKEKKRSV